MADDTEIARHGLPLGPFRKSTDDQAAEPSGEELNTICDLSDQERSFTQACQELGYTAARRGHIIVASDDHPASADWGDLSDGVRSLINESDTFIGLWSASYQKSSWCPQESEYAMNRMHKGTSPS